MATGRRDWARRRPPTARAVLESMVFVVLCAGVDSGDLIGSSRRRLDMEWTEYQVLFALIEIEV